MTQLDKVFTVAADDEDDDCQLLFASLQEDKTVLSPQEMLRITSDPRFQEVVGSGGGLVRLNSNVPTLLATTNLEEHAIARMDSAENDEKVLVFDAEEGIHSINLHDAYYGCTLPHKIIVGCSECMLRETSRQCEIKRLGVRAESDDRWSALEVWQTFNSRKDSIAGYTYISPKLTAPEYFAKTFREVDEHDFTEVEDNSATIRKGLVERGRRRRFKKAACAQCLVMDDCRRVYASHQEKFCRGPYAETEEEAVAAILSKHEIAFSEEELLYLALNSGAMERRYNRCKYWATFTTSCDGRLIFGRSRYTSGEFEEIKSFTEAKEFIQEYGNWTDIRDFDKPLTPLLKALLIELGSYDRSPVQVSRWHRTEYQVVGITYDRHSPKWKLNFIFNNYGGTRSYRPYGLLLPWYVNATNFGDVFEEYTGLQTLSKSSHPDSYGETHNEKWR